MKTQTPKGVRDLLPDEVERRSQVVKDIKVVSKKNGYRRIITPTYELYDVLKRGMGPKLKNMAIRFFDHNGDQMVLRPDMTTPIARSAANRMSHENQEQRLYYSANIYRQQKVASGKDTEFYQAGIELIGKSGVEADAEVIAIAVESMKSVGLKDFMVDIGHMDVIRNLDSEKISALEHQDYVSFGQLPERGIENTIEKFPYFGELYEELKKRNVHQHVCFNLGLVKEIGYYTGVVFECYVKGFGYFVGSGGRYDDLVGCYGVDAPAVGFAFGVERLLMALELERNK